MRLLVAHSTGLKHHRAAGFAALGCFKPIEGVVGVKAGNSWEVYSRWCRDGPLRVTARTGVADPPHYVPDRDGTRGTGCARGHDRGGVSPPSGPRVPSPSPPFSHAPSGCMTRSSRVMRASPPTPPLPTFLQTEAVLGMQYTRLFGISACCVQWSCPPLNSHGSNPSRHLVMWREVNTSLHQFL